MLGGKFIFHIAIVVICLTVSEGWWKKPTFQPTLGQLKDGEVKSPVVIGKYEWLNNVTLITNSLCFRSQKKEKKNTTDTSSAKDFGQRLFYFLSVPRSK